MKNKILSLAVILIMGLTSAFASTNDDINQRAIASFKKDFVTATNVSWQQEKTYTKATFTLNDQVMFAYYSNENTELLAVVRNLLSEQLPINLLIGLQKDYKSYWITDIFEAATQDHTTYYVTLENSEETLVLSANGSNEWTLYEKTRK